MHVDNFLLISLFAHIFVSYNGDTYSEFLSKPIKTKIFEDVEYDWMLEGCEDEYQNYPIKFKLKYS